MSQMLGRGLSWAWAAFALVLAIGTYAHAESSLDDIRARGLIRVGVKTDAPPFGAFDEDGRHVGFEIDLARFFARVLFDDDNRTQLVPVTTRTRVRGTSRRAGSTCWIATVTATEERRSLAELSEPYFISASWSSWRRRAGWTGSATLPDSGLRSSRDPYRSATSRSCSRERC